MAVSPNRLERLDREALGALYQASRRIARSRGAPLIERALLQGVREATDCVSSGLYELRCDAAVELLLLVGPDGACGLPLRLSPDMAWAEQIRHAHPEAPRSLTLTVPGDAADTLRRTLTLAPVRGAAALHGVVAALWPAAAPRADTPGMAALLALGEDAGYALDRAVGAPATYAGDADRVRHLLASVSAVTDIGLLYSGLIDRLLQTVLRQILQVMGLGGGAIFLYSETFERVDLAVCERGPETDYGDDPAALWAGQLLVHTLAHARETARHCYPSLMVYAAEAGADERSLGAALRRLRAANLVSVPLLAGGWLTGVLQVVAAPGASLDEDQVELLRLLARQTAAAVENARLFAQTRADQERTRAVVDATNDAILVLDEHRRPLIVNRRARFFFGLTERDLLGKSFEQLGGVFGRIFEDGQRFNGWLDQLLRSRSDRAVEEFGIRSPETRLLQCFSAPVMDVQDRYLGRILVFRDITREREVERMKSDFVSTVSHELRTPLTSIQGALQLVLGRPGSANSFPGEGMHQRARDLLSISLTNTERLIRLINDILDVAKIEQGRIQLRREAIAPEELCRSSAAAMGALANAREISVELQFPRWLPSVLADRDRSLQVLINLLSNAIKFSSASQRVVLSARHDGQMVVFAVRDWGRGIAAEHQSALFQKFQQIDSSATRDVGGTGLGLVISKALVEEQGGRMWLTSAAGEGSTFSFTLPLAPGSASGPERPLALLAEAASERHATLSAALEEAGWDVRSATSTAQLVAIADLDAVDLVVLGWILEARDEALLRQLRTLPGTLDAPLLLLRDHPPAQPSRYLTTLPADASPEAVVAQARQLRAEWRPLVLVVEDDPHVRPVLVRLLRRYGMRVASASDGYGALAALERNRPDLVLLDLKMSGLDGFEVLRRIQASPAIAHIPVIILTANDLSEAARAQGRALGACAFLEKPVAYERLVSTINSVLESRGR